jgi:predicted ATPase
MRPGLVTTVAFVISMLSYSWLSRAFSPTGARSRMRSRPIQAPSFLVRELLFRHAATLSLYIERPEDMHDLGAVLSQIATQRGDVLLLDGDLGAGKTCLSRGFVQTLVGEHQRVTSPTYLLCNSYPIVHSNVETNNSPRM